MPKNHKEHKKRKKKTPLFKRIFIRLIFIIFILFSFALLIYCIVLPSVIFNKKESKNILIVSDNLDEQSNYIMLAHTSYNSDNNFILFINGKETIDVGNEYGNYNLNSVYKLLKIDNKSDQKIKSVFSGILNIIIDDVVVVDSINLNNLNNLNNFNNKELEGLFLKNVMRRTTDLMSNKINLLKLHFLSSKVDIFQLDSIGNLKKIYYRLSTLDENTYQNCSVSVVNSTNKNGLAHKVSKIIENTGAQVMQIEGSDFAVKQTTIYYPVDKKECRQLANKISEIFSRKAVLSLSSEIPVNQQFRSNIVVIIGENY